MTEALVEKIARLMAKEAKDWAESRGRSCLDYDQMPKSRQEQMRHAARAILRKLGH